MVNGYQRIDSQSGKIKLNSCSNLPTICILGSKVKLVNKTEILILWVEDIYLRKSLLCPSNQI